MTAFDDRGIVRWHDVELMADIAMRARARGDGEVARMASLLPGVLEVVIQRDRVAAQDGYGVPTIEPLESAGLVRVNVDTDRLTTGFFGERGLALTPEQVDDLIHRLKHANDQVRNV